MNEQRIRDLAHILFQLVDRPKEAEDIIRTAWSEAAAEQRELADKDAKRWQWARRNPEWLGFDHDMIPKQIDDALDAAIAKRIREGSE